jgi:hypothetical protein
VYEKRAYDAWYIPDDTIRDPGHGLTLVEAAGDLMKPPTLAFISFAR